MSDWHAFQHRIRALLGYTSATPAQQLPRRGRCLHHPSFSFLPQRKERSKRFLHSRHAVLAVAPPARGICLCGANTFAQAGRQKWAQSFGELSFGRHCLLHLLVSHLDLAGFAPLRLTVLIRCNLGCRQSVAHLSKRPNWESP